MLFGEFLVQRGLVTEEEVLRAVDTQAQSRIPLGRLAVDNHFLAGGDLFRILSRQRKTSGKRFGEIAIELGLLTKEQAEKLLEIQGQTSKKIGDILVSQSALSQNSLNQALKDFHAAPNE
ncbi:MAG: hypothetical protein ACE5G9_10935 [Nitrospinales bacterium]